MKILAMAMLLALPASANGSRPIVEGDAIACIRGGAPSNAAEVHTVSINNDEPVTVLGPEVLGTMVVLKASTAYSAVFEMGDLTTQTLTFSFKDLRSDQVCFRFDNTKNSWSVGDTPADICNSCFNADGT